ncbi:hypothetical protein AB0C33_19990 [Nonomuraea sp. NPDC048881]
MIKSEHQKYLGADEDRPAGSDRDAGGFRAEIHNVVVLVAAEPAPGAAQ